MTTDAAVFPPRVDDASPDQVRAGTSESITLQGANLAAAGVLPPGASFSVTDLVTAADTLSFTLAVTADAPPSVQTFRVRNPDGDATFDLSILPRSSAASTPSTPLCSVFRSATPTVAPRN